MNLSRLLRSNRKNHALFLTMVIVLASAWPVYSYMVKGDQVQLKTTTFDNNLSSSDNDVQKMAETIDDLTLGGSIAEKVEFVISGNGGIITAGASGHKAIPFAGTIQKWEIVSSVSGSIAVDVKKSTYAGYATFSSIAGSEKPAISAGIKNTDTNLTTWATAVIPGDRIQVLVDSADINGVVIVTLYIQRGS